MRLLISLHYLLVGALIGLAIYACPYLGFGGDSHNVALSAGVTFSSFLMTNAALLLFDKKGQKNGG